MQRAVVFLDPYGMNVEWATIAAIAATKAIDLWVLFPFAIGANRMMPKDQPPNSIWAEKLTTIFGTEDWKSRFYGESRAANVPFFFKQWGGVRKDLTGRELNGRMYDEMPGRLQPA